jgi:hypothetical protein
MLLGTEEYFFARVDTHLIDIVGGQKIVSLAHPDIEFRLSQAVEIIGAITAHMIFLAERSQPLLWVGD